ncbi:MAG TPA: PH domain-containing protein [Candidatus Krumholzibacteriaceae bacterium]|jgi:uncharacterized membrane protein YdbT with pleckstrin-like domain|nr:PH domain-containing protein [Candidatus Krumholzibacteriaceae bacterium]
MQNPSMNTRSLIWAGKPWILPSALVRSIVIFIVAVVVSWLEFSYLAGMTDPILKMPILLWTGLVFFIVWVASLAHLLLLRASNTYILRNDGLEVRYGIVSSKSFVLSPSGFSDLEVIRSVSGRIIGIGDMVVRTQGERDVKMVRVRHPLEVADKIRQVMARPIVRIEGS